MDHCVRCKGAASQNLRADGSVAGPLDSRSRAQRHIAVPRVAPTARRTLFAWRSVGNHDWVADRDILHAFPNLLDDSRSLMPKHDRELHAVPMEHLYGQIGVADSAGNDANQNFARLGRINRNVANDGRRARLL